MKLENLLHRVFAAAQLNIEIKDRFGNPVRPREWFLIPIFIVDEVIQRIKDTTITDYVYDPTTALPHPAVKLAGKDTPPLASTHQSATDRPEARMRNPVSD